MHKRNKSVQSRNLFTPLDLNSTRYSTTRFKAGHPTSSRHYQNIDQNHRPLSQDFRWITDRTFAFKQQQQKHLSQTLASIRKTFNIRISQTNQLKQKTRRLKEYIKDTNKQIECYQYSTQGLKKRIRKTQFQIQQSRHKQEEAEFNKKILENILERMRVDKMFYTLKEKQNQKNLKQKTFKIIQQQEKMLNVQNIETTTNGQLGKISLQCGKLDALRQAQIIEAKTAINRQIKQRTIIQQSDLVPSFKQIYSRKMLLIHQMLQQILRSKISRLIDLYKNLENSYRKIKAATNINNFEDISNEYFSKKSLHNNLAKQKLKLQKQQSEYEERNNILLDKLRKLQILNITQIRAQKFKKVQIIQQTVEQDNFTIDMIQNWARIKTSRMNINFGTQSLSDIVKQICYNLLELTKSEEGAKKYWNKKFFSEGISIKRQPKVFAATRDKNRLAMMNNVREFNQTELDFLNKIRNNIKKHQKSRTEGQIQ